ncbi:MAG: four helix bundle protein [Bacteroidales bacterium]|nr:four helix bundle protein [Bacteroidales bacterium]
MNGSYKDLKVYNLAYSSAMEIFGITKTFPKEELYSLTDQIRRSSRAVPANIAEAYRKRRYPKHFTSKITDADAEASETSTWLDFAKDCHYLQEPICKILVEKYAEIGKMLNSMASNPERFLPKGT